MANNIDTSSPYKQFLQIPNAQAKTDVSTQNPNLSIPNAPIASISLESIEKEEKSNAFTKTVASVAIIGGIIGLVFAKGLSGKFFKQLNSHLQRMDDKIYEYTQKYNSLSTLQKFYLNFTKKTKNVLEWLKGGNNITAMKDSGFKWLCDKLYLTKPMNWVTEQFKKLTVLTSKKAYENARNVTDTNIAKLRELIPLLKEEDAATLKILLQKLETQISGITNATTRNQRLKAVEQATSDVGEKVGKELWQITKNPTKENLEKLRLYRTDVHSAAGKEALTNELQKAQRDFTFNIEDKTKILKEAKEELGQIIKADDKEARAVLRKLTSQIKQYASLSGNNEAQKRSALITDIEQTLNSLSKESILSKYSEDTQKLFNLQINEIRTVLNNTDQKGTIEDILVLLNKSGFREANPNAYNRAKVLTNEIRNVTNKAFENELKLYDKYAEYSVGSAPTDVLGLILPIALGGYAISKGDDKDEKISATLKAGIPILGGIATTFIATAKMMTNMQGLVLGAVAGLLLNALGSKADEQYKEYKENNLFVQKAIAAYKQNNLA